MPAANLAEFVGEEDDHFSLGEHQCGAFGGIFGGILGACCVLTARHVAPGRRPFALDVTFLRAMPPGVVVARAEIVRAGRTLSCVAITLTAAGDDPARCSTRAIVLLADPDAVADRNAPGAAPARPIPPHDHLAPVAKAPHPIPIVETLAPRTGRLEDGAVVSSIDTPWVCDPSQLPEAACLAADLCVGAPVFAGMGRPWLAHPNPDMSLRFTGTSAEVSPIAGVGRLESITAGVATVRTEVWADGALLAAGASTSLLLAD